jgi:hypothetical protein
MCDITESNKLATETFSSNERNKLYKKNKNQLEYILLRFFEDIGIIAKNLKQ